MRSDAVQQKTWTHDSKGDNLANVGIRRYRSDALPSIQAGLGHASVDLGDWTCKARWSPETLPRTDVTGDSSDRAPTMSPGAPRALPETDGVRVFPPSTGYRPDLNIDNVIGPKELDK